MLPFALYDPVLPAVQTGTKDISVVAKDGVKDIANDVPYAGWSYGGTIPGRMPRVLEGDTVTVTFRVDPDELTPSIGPPLVGSFQRLHGLRPDDAVRAVGFYREYFATKRLYETELCPGVPDLLPGLRAAGETLILATSKPMVFAERILAHVGIARFFDLVAGSNLDHTRVEKAEVIAFALGERPRIASRRAVMVGDRGHDVLGARANGVPAIGVA